MAGTVDEQVEPKPNVAVLQVARDPTALRQVEQLWRRSSATLGFFTEGAFAEYAARGQILCAYSGERVVGYLLYRCSRARATIVHLCISPGWRGRGLARTLMQFLKQETAPLEGVGLSCRRDYSMAKMWAALGFIAQYERPGRGKDRAPITFWWFDHGHPTLFDGARGEAGQSLKVVIDANVFFDLDDDSDDEADESKAILEEWIFGQLTLLITRETLNEVDRNVRPVERERQRRRYAEFEEAKASHSEFQRAHAALVPALPVASSEQDDSDRRQLAWAAASDAAIFLTRDQRILDCGDAIYEAAGLKVLRPSALIGDLDAVERESEYRPARLAGSGIIHGRLTDVTEKDLAHRFQRSSDGESRPAFLRRLREALIKPREWSVYSLTNASSQIVAVYAVRDLQDHVHVSIFRVRANSLTSTLARQLAARVVRSAADRHKNSVVITDAYAAPEVRRALEEEGFTNTRGHRWEKVLMYGVLSISEALQRVGVAYPASASNAGRDPQSSDAPADTSRIAAMIERRYWPIRVAGANLPCFLIPIKAHWAKELFDEQIASRDLFGSNNNVALLPSNVYYRSARQRIVAAPGRIAWYITADDRIPESASVRAVSILDEVVVGPASALFKKYRRFGIYSWSDLLRQADGNPDSEVMVIEFSKTELLDRPLNLTEVRVLAKRHGVRVQVRSPWKVPEDFFLEIVGSPNNG